MEAGLVEIEAADLRDESLADIEGHRPHIVVRGIDVEAAHPGGRRGLLRPIDERRADALAAIFLVHGEEAEVRVAAPLDQREDEDADDTIANARDTNAPGWLLQRDGKHISPDALGDQIEETHDRVVVALRVRRKGHAPHLSHPAAPR